MSKARTKHILAGYDSDGLVVAVNLTTDRFLWLSDKRQAIDGVKEGRGVALEGMYNLQTTLGYITKPIIVG